MQDNWTLGYIAGLNGATYADNPNDSTAWAFGCSEGMKERNRRAFAVILERLAQ